MSNHSLHFNICAFSEEDYSLQEELSMIKATLLYADNITIVSPSLVQAMTSYNIYGENMQNQITIAREDINKLKEKIQDVEDEVHQLHLLGKDIEINRKQLREDLIKLLDILPKGIDSEYQKRTEVISKLISDNRIIFPIRAYCEADLNSSEKIGEIYKELFSCFLNTLYSNNGFNLCNYDLYDFLQLISNKIPVNESQLEKFKHAKIVNDLITGLPNFEFAEIDEILDIKKELSKPLVNFRKAIFDFSKQIKSAPWDNDFKYDCQKLYHTQIAPSLNELEQKIKDNNVFKNICASLINKELLLPMVAGITGGIVSGLSSLVVGSAIDINSGLVKNAKKIQDVKNNSLYFYYQAQKKLAKQKKRRVKG